MQLGAALIVGFIVIRAVNIYGDPSRWSVQPTGVKTMLSFLAVSSIRRRCCTADDTRPRLFFFGAFDRGARGVVARIFITFGRVPMFFYVLQWITAHALAIVATKLAGKPADFLFGNIVVGPPPPPGFGFGLGRYISSLEVIAIYPLCVWFAGVKARRRDWWLSYL